MNGGSKVASKVRMRQGKARQTKNCRGTGRDEQPARIGSDTFGQSIVVIQVSHTVNKKQSSVPSQSGSVVVVVVSSDSFNSHLEQ